ncbi:unnamed protein product [Diamesa hyperborea]
MTKFIIQIVILVLINYVMYSQSVEFTDCGSVTGSFSKISVTNCSSTEGKRCILTRNSNATIQIDFSLNNDVEVTEVKAVCHGIIMGMAVPFPLPNSDGCSGCNLVCPLKKGENYEYSTTLPVLKVYPQATVDVKWELKDNNNNVIICVLIPAKIH